MRFSYKLFSVFNIDLELHILFILFILFLFLLNPIHALLLIEVFIFVTLHEIAHSLTARKYKVKVKKILLLPIGGIALMDIQNLKPKQEIVVSLAGPVLNFVFVLLGLFIAASFNLEIPTLEDLFSKEIPLLHLFLFYSIYANLILGVFNLFLPAFPLDGGRILRAVLALKFDILKATQYARMISMLASIFLLIIAFFSGNFWLLFIAFFIILSANSELGAIKLQYILKSVPASAITSRIIITVDPDESVYSAVQKLFAFGAFSGIAINKKIKVFELKSLSSLDKSKWKSAKVKKFLKTVPPVKASDTSQKVFEIMQKHDVDTVPVVEENKILGVATKDNIELYLRFREILGGG
ncbi:MAG: site-2 protease family protein [archaeon]